MSVIEEEIEQKGKDGKYFGGDRSTKGKYIKMKEAIEQAKKGK
ncbi:hypothetical protein [Streptococcus catagoni]|nr:hypothetical protein [Streptococcus catagoni]